MREAASFFVDTNVLLYALNSNEPLKQPAAREWLLALFASKAARISWQVVFEFYYNAVRKLDVPAAVARKTAAELVQFEPQSPHEATLLRAWHWCDAAQINFWDALIVASAEQAGCRWLLSEDFQSGRRFGSLFVVSPFRQRPGDFN